MRTYRRVIKKENHPGGWTLRLECGHEAFRSHRYTPRELPNQALCDACDLLIGSRVRKPLGTMGTITSYSGDGRFDVEWNDSPPTHWTLDELREAAEIV